jgi:predicted nucleic acid-binding protein
VRAVVLDSSVALTWCFRDQRTAYTESILRGLIDDSAVVPDLWWLEIANVTAMAERRGHLDSATRIEFTSLLRSLRITTEPGDSSRTMGQVFDLAQRHRLTVYDATYLELAKRLGTTLASLDEQLRRAAGEAGVELARGD